VDPTVELSVKDELDWMIERSNEIAAICWQKCPVCNGRGETLERWEAEDGGPDFVLHPLCDGCSGQCYIQLHDPWRIEALYDAADDARKEMGVWCYTRITKALALAVNGAVEIDIDGIITVQSETGDGNYYLVTICWNCLDAHHRAPKMNDVPHCKHQIAVLLVNAAKEKMYDQEPKHYGPWSDVLDGLISAVEADRWGVE